VVVIALVPFILFPQFRVRFVELSSLEAYLDSSVLSSKTHGRELEVGGLADVDGVEIY
jgi:hypothetical protein